LRVDDTLVKATVNPKLKTNARGNDRNLHVDEDDGDTDAGNVDEDQSVADAEVSEDVMDNARRVLDAEEMDAERHPATNNQKEAVPQPTSSATRRSGRGIKRPLSPSRDGANSNRNSAKKRKPERDRNHADSC